MPPKLAQAQTNKRYAAMVVDHNTGKVLPALIRPLRWLTVRLPHRHLSGLCHLLNAGLDLYITACRVLPLPLRGYVRNVPGKMAREKRYLIIYDQLNPAYAKHYREDEARALLTDAGFVNVKTHHRHGYSWTVIGTKPDLEVC